MVSIWVWQNATTVTVLNTGSDLHRYLISKVIHLKNDPYIRLNRPFSGEIQRSTIRVCIQGPLSSPARVCWTP